MSSGSLNGQTILVAEDHDDVRIYLEAFLRHTGANVVGVRNATEGLEAIKNHRITLVLSDILMPGGGGFELLRDIRGLGENGETAIPAIAMTGLDSLADGKRILSAGFRAYLRKPFTPETLLETIKSVLANRAESGTGVSSADGRM
jgi:CheY-like chemotaxis protein